MIDKDLKEGDLALFIDTDTIVVKILSIYDEKETWYAHLEDLADRKPFWIGYNKARFSEVMPFILKKHTHETG